MEMIVTVSLGVTTAKALRKSQSRSNIRIMTIETLTYLGLAFLIGLAIGHAKGSGKC